MQRGLIIEVPLEEKYFTEIVELKENSYQSRKDKQNLSICFCYAM